MIPFGPWEPDKGRFSPDTIDTVNNLNPLANGWGPFADLEEVGSALAGQCLGLWQARASDGTITIIAGTASGLYKYNTATLSWDDISGASAPYNVQAGHLWQAIQFGTKFIVVNLEDPPQVYDVDAGGTFSDLAGTPPQAKFIWIAGDFVVLGYLKVGSTEYPQRIHWSGINDATYWTIDRIKGCDRQDLPDGNEITGGFGFPGAARIFQRDAKRAMIFTGGMFIFEMRVLDATRGCPSPYSIVPISSNDYVFWRTDGIYRGDDNIPIGAQRVDGYLFGQPDGDVDVSSLDTVQGVADPFNKIVLWCYLSAGGVQKIVGWDWELDQFFPLDTAAEYVFSSAAPGLSLEAADAYADDVDAVGAPSLDSRIYRGGAPTLGAITSSDKLGYFSGGAMAATIETNTIELNPDNRSFVNGVKLKGDPGSSTTIEVGTAILPDDTVSFGTAYTRSSRTGLYPARKDGFYHRFRVTTAAGDTSFTHIHGVSPQVQPSGEA